MGAPMSGRVWRLLLEWMTSLPHFCEQSLPERLSLCLAKPVPSLPLSGVVSKEGAGLMTAKTRSGFVCCTRAASSV